VGSGKRPVQKYQLLWAGPWYRDRFPRGTVPSAIPVATAMPVSSAMPSMPMPRSSAMPSDTPMPMSAGDAAALVNGRSIFLTNTDVDGTRITTATPTRYYQSCAVCHGPDGAGGVQLADGAISAKLGSQAHMLDMASMGSTNAKKTPWTLALFERAISTGVDQNGDRLSSVMPRWKMSKRDLHDVALYISTQIR